MLRIYNDILDWIEAITPLIRQIARHDPNLATQLERASTSVAFASFQVDGPRGRVIFSGSWAHPIFRTMGPPARGA
jgi:hypothetical protein